MKEMNNIAQCAGQMKTNIEERCGRKIRNRNSAKTRFVCNGFACSVSRMAFSALRDIPAAHTHNGNGIRAWNDMHMSFGRLIAVRRKLVQCSHSLEALEALEVFERDSPFSN